MIFSWAKMLRQAAARIRSGQGTRPGPPIRRRTRDTILATQALVVRCESLEERRLLSAIVISDQPDYSPGSMATFTAANDATTTAKDFQPGETIELQVARTDGITAFGDSTLSWDVTAGRDGSVQTSWYVDPQYAGASLQVTAKGLTSGALATEAFSDSDDDDNKSFTNTGNTITTSFGANYVFSAADFPFRNSETSNTTLASVKVKPVTGSSTGSLQFFSSGAWATINSDKSVTASDLSSGWLRYVPGTSASASFKYNVTDSARKNGSDGIINLQVANSTTTTLSSSSSLQYGDSTTFTATVAATSGTPTGAVTFYEVDNNGTILTTLGSATLATVSGSQKASLTLTATHANGLDAGSYHVDAVYAGVTGKFSKSTSSSNSLSVSKKALTVTGMNAGNKTYDGKTNATLNTSSAALSGVVSGDTVTLGGTAVGTFASSHVGNAITITVSGPTISGAQAADYTLTLPSTTANISQATLKFTIANDSQTYGSPANLATDLGTTISTGVNGENLKISYASSGATATAHVGNYNITGTVSDGTGLASDYTVNLTNGTLSVNKAVVNYTIGNDNQTYGSPANLAADLGTTINTGVNGQNLKISYASVGDTTAAHAGKYAITGVVSDGTGETSDYTVNLTNGTLSVNKAVVNYTIGNDSQTYGSPANLASDLGTTINTGVNGENLAIAYGSVGDTATAHVGNYDITGNVSDGGGLASDYTVNLTNGTLSVKKAVVNYTIGNDSQTYGSPANLASDLGTTINTGVNGENLAIAYGSVGDTATAHVGTYDITGTVSDGSGLASDYTVNLTNGTLTVNKAVLGNTNGPTNGAVGNNNFQIGNVSQPYGSPADFTIELGATIATGINGENLAITYASAGDTSTAHVGTYDITGTLADGTGLLSDYTITLTNGTLTVNKAVVNYTIANDAQTYGSPADLAADLGTTIETGVNGENLAIAYSSDGNTGVAHVGTYVIAGLVADGTGLLSDYEVHLTSGVLTVNQANAQFLCNDNDNDGWEEMEDYEGYDYTYDGTAHTLPVMVTGVGGVDLTSSLVLDTTHTHAGVYHDNWTFHDASGDYADASGFVTNVIRKAYAKISLTGFKVTYDATAHTATGSATGVNGEALDGMDLSLSTHTNAGYYNNQWYFTDTTGNYRDATGWVGTTIGRATATITVIPANATFDGKIHMAQGTVTGVDGVALAGLDLSTTAHTSARSYYDTWAFRDPTGNYFGASANIVDVINKADATINLSGYSVTYDAQAHTAKGTVTGVLGESLAGLVVTGSTHTKAGVYIDSWSFTDATGNYNTVRGQITDTISKADANISISNYNVVYDTLAHTATGTVTGVNGVKLTGLTVSSTKHTNAGTYTDSWTFADTTGNYNSVSGTIVDTIQQAAATISVTGYRVAFDNKSHVATGSAKGLNNANLTGLTLTGTAHTAAGQYTDTWTFHDKAGNYADAQGTVTDTIVSARTAIALTATPATGTAAGQLKIVATVSNIDSAATVNAGVVTVTIDGQLFTGAIAVTASGAKRVFTLTAGLAGSAAGTAHQVVVNFADTSAAGNFASSALTQTATVTNTDSTRSGKQTGAYALTYWGSSTGTSLLNSGSGALLKYLNSQIAANVVALRNADGTSVTSFASTAAFQSWLSTTGSSSNYSAQLSAQLACLVLNVKQAAITGSMLIDATQLLSFHSTLGNGSGVATVSALITQASSNLGNTGVSDVAGGREAVFANLVADINNNGSVYFASTAVKLS
ncbi:MAG: hypothetical protein JSS02_33455 [Planctomycetes bacterium]|nr:hypothetical protein [Planctomycetota bacterium]